MSSNWLTGLIGLVIGLILAGGGALVLEGLDDGDDDDQNGAAALVCQELDAAELGALVIVSSPSAGERVHGQLAISGCAATFEQNVQYRVTDQTGVVLAEGFTTATAPDVGIAGEFTAQVDIASLPAGLISLEVFEEDASDGEGNPPPRQVIPLIAG